MDAEQRYQAMRDRPTRFDARVVDALSGDELDGVPTPVLFAASKGGEVCLSCFREGEWSYVDPAPRNLAWHRSLGREVRLVRVVLEGQS